MKKQKALSRINPVFLQGLAHRGLHNERFTENGMNAFKNAIDHGTAFEFDIHLTKDNELVVCHDENLVRTTGKEGIIEDLTLQEIRDNYRLLDGGVIPTFQEVLDLNQEKVPMAIELKVFRKNYKQLASKCKEMLRKNIKDKSNVLLISFDPRSLWPFKHEGYIRSLLVAKSDEYTWFFKFTVESVDLEDVLYQEKRVQRYVKNHFSNVWTIENEEQLNSMLPYVDTVTYQYIDSEIVKKALLK